MCGIVGGRNTLNNFLQFTPKKPDIIVLSAKENFIVTGSKRDIKTISQDVFFQIGRNERCGASLLECEDAIRPLFCEYTCAALDFIKDKTYPTWRTNKEKTRYIGEFQVSRENAEPTSFIEFAKYEHLFNEILFDKNQDYFLTNNIIVFHCVRCGVHVVKDGNHRLLACAYHGKNPILNVYEVSSEDWSNAKVDMKNFCGCTGGT
jgi:hypothetical protein